MEIFFLRSSREILFFSKNVTQLAPRLNASKPSAPEPENRSNTLIFSKDNVGAPFANKLNKLSLTRSEVGRRWLDKSPIPISVNLRPRFLPDIMRILI